jgi:hypothetical protein
MLGDYPPAIQAAVPPRTEAERKLALRLGLPFLLVLILYPFVATFLFHSQSAGQAGFSSLWLYAFLVIFAFNLWDWLVLDWLVFCTITPKWLVIPGSEGHPAYKDYAFHFRGFLIGTVFSAALGLIVAGIATLVR